MNGRRVGAMFAVLAVVTLTATACSGGPAAQRPDDAVVIAWGDEPDNLNPVLSFDIYRGNELPIFNGLLRYGKDLSHEPELAAELPAVSPDGRTVTVRLRPDVTFHDGTPLTAEDVVFTYNSVLDPAVASGFRSQLDAVRSVAAVDRTTVRFSLNRIDPAFPDKLHLGIVPQHLLDGQDLNTAAFNADPVGAGPYVFKEWRKGERLVVEANPGYVGGAPKIRRVVFVFVSDENARAAVLENGSADVAAVPPRLVARLRDADGVRVVEVPSGDARIVPLANQNPVFGDPRVRRALSWAVNRQQMVDGVLAGAGAPAVGPVRPGHWASSPDSQVGYDPNRARQMLDQAGWTDQNGDGVREKNGARLSFTLTYGASSSVRKDLALVVRENLAQVGVDVQLEGLGYEAIKARLDRDPAVFGYGTSYDPDLVVYQEFHSRFATDDDPYTGTAKMVSPRVDAALDAARSTVDRAQRVEAYRELQRALVEDGSYLFLVWLDHPFALSNRVSGIDPQVEGHDEGPSPALLWNIEDWELTRARP